MLGFWRYLRAHPWQRRLVTLTGAIVLGAGAALLLYPVVSDYLLVRALGSDDPAARLRAIERCVEAARASQRTREYLNSCLDTDSDVQFAAIAAVLKRVGAFHTPDRTGLQIDRLRAIELETTRSASDPEGAAHVRWLVLAEVIRAGSDNRYVRRALAGAVGDDHPEVRCLAAVLAARLKDDGALRKLLADGDARVAAEAALCAGIAGRQALAGALEKLLDRGHTEVVSSAAYATALLGAPGGSKRICTLLRNTRDEALRDRLLHVAGVLNDDQARSATEDVLAAAARGGTFASAAALLAGGELKLPAARNDVLRVLAAAPKRPPGLLESQVVAALQASEALAMPIRKQANDICVELWGPQLTQMLMTAARVLGRQADVEQPDSAAPSREAVVATLRRAVAYHTRPATQPAGTPPKPIYTPRASSAAAVALWLLEAREAEHFVRNVTALGETLPGDYVAWHVGTSGREGAFELGLAMLPALDAAPEQKVYNDDERSAGAMLLALAARAPEQKAIAAGRIRSRLAGGKLGGEDSFLVRGAYQSALAILGEPGPRADVRKLLEIIGFPRRRAITALCVAGDRAALDWLLWNTQVSHADISFLLVELGIGEVLARVAPQLPRIEPAAGPELRRWQAQILQDTYAIRRERIRLALRD